MTARIAKRGTRPAHEQAPRRVRQSDVIVPFQFLDEEKTGWLSKVLRGWK